MAILESKSAPGRSAADLALRRLGARPEDTCGKYLLGITLTGAAACPNGLRPLARRSFVPG